MPRTSRASPRRPRGLPPAIRPQRSPTESIRQQRGGRGSTTHTARHSQTRRPGRARTGLPGRTRSPRTPLCRAGRTRRARGTGDRRRAASRPPRGTRSRSRRSRRWTPRCDSGVRGGCRRAPSAPSPPWRVAPRRGTRPARSSGVLQDAIGAGGHRVPNRERLRQRGPAAVREPVVLPRHAALRLLPTAQDEPPLLQPPKRRVQRSLLEVEEAVRLVAELAQDLEAVFLPLRQEGQQAQLDRTFLQFRGPLGGDFRHRTRLVSGTRYMAVRGPAASGGRTSFIRGGEVGDVMVDGSSREEKKEKGGDAPLTSACVAPEFAGRARG